MNFIKKLIIFSILFLCIAFPSNASRTSDSYDGNIFPIYAGNGSIVPPSTSLKESINNNRITVLFFYIDDSSASKSLAPIIAGLDLIWRNEIDIIALTTDELQGETFLDPLEEGYYWEGNIPQTLIIDGSGEVKFNKEGLVDIDEMNKIISMIKGIEYVNPSFIVESFNEYNSSISRKNTSIKNN
tara:strand:+ start:2487 stop:3041 length:555 start_codon:yes stop_codon:yes gene_type:complete